MSIFFASVVLVVPHFAPFPDWWEAKYRLNGRVFFSPHEQDLKRGDWYPTVQGSGYQVWTSASRRWWCKAATAGNPGKSKYVACSWTVLHEGSCTNSEVLFSVVNSCQIQQLMVPCYWAYVRLGSTALLSLRDSFEGYSWHQSLFNRLLQLSIQDESSGCYPCLGKGCSAAVLYSESSPRKERENLIYVRICPFYTYPTAEFANFESTGLLLLCL